MSTWPSAEIARMATLCQPSARSVYATGEVHVVNAASSSEHWKVASGLFEVNATDALVSDVGSAGPELIVVSGGRMMVQLQLAGVGSKRPASSTARTRS